MSWIGQPFLTLASPARGYTTSRNTKLSSYILLGNFVYIWFGPHRKISQPYFVSTLYSSINCMHASRKFMYINPSKLGVRGLSDLDGWMDSEPYGAGSLEHGHELAGEVQRHDLVGGADEPAADEDGGDGRRAAEAAGELPLHVAAARVLVELVHRRAHAELGD